MDTDLSGRAQHSSSALRTHKLRALCSFGRYYLSSTLLVVSRCTFGGARRSRVWRMLRGVEQSTKCASVCQGARK